MLAAYRRTGADLPFGDVRRTHGTAFEGWFWRFTQPRDDSVLIVLCGVSRDAVGRTWGTAGLAAHPGGVVRSVVLDRAHAPPGDRVVHLGEDGHGGHFAPDRLRMRIGPDAHLDATIEQPAAYPRRLFGAIGGAQLVPRLSQCWQPLLLGGSARGHAQVGDTTIALDGAHVYAEKNWGHGGFAQTWWWGQAQGFADPDVCVAFAGGLAGVGKLRVSGTSLVVRVGGEVLRVVAPLGRLNVEVGVEGWRLRSAGGIELEGHANGTAPHLLPIPVPAQRRHLEGAAAQHLAGHVRLRVRRRGRLLFEGESLLAGLETGDAVAASARENARAWTPSHSTSSSEQPSQRTSAAVT